MTVVDDTAAVAAVANGRAAQRPPARRGNAMSYGFVALYAVLALAFGVLPALYALFLAFTDGDGAFAGLTNFTRVFDDFRFWPAVWHVALYLIIWLVA